VSENPKIFINPKSGSFRFTGTADFVDSDGNVLETKTDFKLCGCGNSQDKPWCDGTHSKKDQPSA
jgi:CDGSH-type Zn-finger protein